MVFIDGSLGEGGGQVLRSALSLALLTGTPVRLDNIRARRAKPGLMAQHLKSVEAAGAVGMARIEGAALGASSLLFEPHGICAGDFQFDIGTAGSTSLVLQTVFTPLSFAPSASTVLLTGGTHVPRSPCFHYLDLHWARFMRQAGYDGRLELELAGFYPRGGGRVRAVISPARKLSPLRLTERGELKRIWGISAAAKLSRDVAERQRRRALERLAGRCRELEIEVRELEARSPGTMLLLAAEFERSRSCYVALGERGKPAERVAEEAAQELLAFLDGDGAIDPYLADQLILPLAVVKGESALRTAKVTEHLLTNAEVVKAFVPAEIEFQGPPGESGLVLIRGVDLSERKGRERCTQ
jgi:RNA 3'-phosphate cyclase